MNRKLWRVVASFDSQIVAANPREAEANLKKHLYEHPEKLKVEVTYITDCELLEAWEVKK